MKKNDNLKKKKLRAYGSTIFFLLLFVCWLFILSHDVFSNNGWGKIIKDIIWAAILGVATFCSFHDARTIGTSKYINDEDERDKYIELQTDKMMYNISQNLILILGIIALVWGLIVGKQAGANDFLAMALVIVAITLLFVWNLLLVIWLIVTYINYRRN